MSYLHAWEYDPYRLPPGYQGLGDTRCPEPARTARDRCGTPQPCPAIPGLMCVRDVDGLPFEYVFDVGREPTTGLWAVTRRDPRRVQRMLPGVKVQLRRFAADMARFGMPIEAILTAGSLYCRCVTNSSHLSNHSFGDAIDVVGVRWPLTGGPASRLRETIVHNWRDPGERRLLQRINGCLRLSFTTVLDYHRTDHRDHFHCDTHLRSRSHGHWSTLIGFVQEALHRVLGRPVPQTGRMNPTTTSALKDFARIPATAALPRHLDPIFDSLFTQVASTP